jgi:hypothetical protein
LQNRAERRTSLNPVLLVRHRPTRVSRIVKNRDGARGDGIICSPSERRLTRP